MDGIAKKIELTLTDRGPMDYFPDKSLTDDPNSVKLIHTHVLMLTGLVEQGLQYGSSWHLGVYGFSRLARICIFYNGLHVRT